MRKPLTVVSLAALVFSGSVVAHQKNSFYVAPYVGIFSANFNNSYLDQTDAIHQNIVQPVTQNSYTLGLALGYRYLLTPAYFLGGEVSENIERHYASFQSGAVTAAFADKTQIKNHIDLVFTPGVFLSSSCSAYLKAGLSYAYLQDSLTSPAGPFAVSTTYNGSQNALGFAAGLGVEKQATQNVTIFTEANYHDYGSVTFSDFQNFTANYQHSSHVYSYNFLIGTRIKVA